MTFSEFEIKMIERAADQFMQKRRPPVHIRSQLDLLYKIENQNVLIFEVRPVWNNPKEKMQLPVAKATYIKSQRTWKIYWQRADLKWHSYSPKPQVETIEQFFSEVEQDPHACFFG